MLKSMTAFARVEGLNPWGKVVWEIRSVNHRYLECSIRLPEGFNALEEQIRKRLRSRILRGKIDCSLYYRAEPSQAKLQVNEQRIQELLTLIKELDLKYNYPLAINPLDILRWPGMLQVNERDNLTLLTQDVLEFFEQVLEKLLLERSREGKELEQLLLQRLANIDLEIATIQQRFPWVLKQRRQRLLERFNDAQLQLDPLRLEQEMLILAQRIDISEELERLENHTKQVRYCLSSQDGVGRQVDFLIQELNREANTLAAKSIDSVVTQSAINLKILIEQMREQIQNVE